MVFILPIVLAHIQLVRPKVYWFKVSEGWTWGQDFGFFLNLFFVYKHLFALWVYATVSWHKIFSSKVFFLDMNNLLSGINDLLGSHRDPIVLGCHAFSIWYLFRSSSFPYLNKIDGITRQLRWCHASLFIFISLQRVQGIRTISLLSVISHAIIKVLC